MRIKISLFLILITAFSTANCQLNKGNWLVGGSATFSLSNGESISRSGSQKTDYTDIAVSPNIGYFLIDKFAFGLKPGFSYKWRNYGNVINEGNIVAGGGYSKDGFIDLGPFIRYYFLPIDQRVNLVTELNYQHGWSITHPGKAKKYNYSFYCGPIVYFNSSVGLEFLVGYYATKTTTYDITATNIDNISKMNGFQINIGFQISLENY